MAKNSSKPHVRHRIRLLAPLMLAAAVALTIWMIAAVSAHYVPETEIILSDYDAGAKADVTSNFTVPLGDVMFDAVATYLPPEWGVASDDDVPDGIEVGELNAVAHLGLTIGAGTCSVTLPADFTLLEATTQGTAFTSTGDLIGGDWNGYDPDCPGGNEKAVCEYVDFLDELFPVRPIARYYGHAVVTTGIESALNFLVFEPGTNLGNGIPSDPDWGYITVTILNDTGVERPAVPGSLGDNCSELISNNTVVGEADGVVLRTNPDAGTYVFRSWSRGQPDADGDGLENSFDTCPFQTNAGDPRIAGGAGTGDTDNDGLDNACDPAPAISNNDHDFDGYHNRADNCPLIPNGLLEADNQLDADVDGIGDACDTVGAFGIGQGPDVVDGDLPEVTNEHEVEILAVAGEETATPTPTPTSTAAATGTATATGTPTPEGTATPTVVAGEGCAPVIPGTYNGLVRLNGVPAAAGYEVTATIDGTEWGSAIVSGGRYALDVPQKLPSAEPCFAGGTITFTLNGATCTPTEEWASGLHDVDLSCAPVATPTVAPPPTTPPPGTPTTPATPVVTPAKPPVTGSGGLGGDQGLPLWAMLVIGWAGLTALAGFGTLTTRIVKR